jgi:hypothetical protein
MLEEKRGSATESEETFDDGFVDRLCAKIDETWGGGYSKIFRECYDAPEPESIAEKLEEVKSYIRKPEDVDPRVFEARRLVEQGLKINSDLLEKIGAHPMLYGSIQYGDARNLDLDLFMFVDEGNEILADPERVHELAGRRLALRCVELESFFQSQVFRIGIVGNPDRGKTTYAYSCFKTLEVLGFPTSYTDLDIYSACGVSISGRVPWEHRPRNRNPTPEEVEANIQAYKQVTSGIAIADFPGMARDRYQQQRLGLVDLAIVLSHFYNLDRREWDEVIDTAGVSSTYLETRQESQPRMVNLPSVYNLNRQPRPLEIDIMVSVTKILEIAAEMKDVPLVDIYERYPDAFSQAEIIILEEVLDFEFAPI